MMTKQEETTQAPGLLLRIEPYIEGVNIKVTMNLTKKQKINDGSKEYQSYNLREATAAKFPYTVVDFSTNQTHDNCKRLKKKFADAEKDHLEFCRASIFIHWLSQGSVMANIPLGNRVSSLFEIGAQIHQPHGTSVTSYAWEPHDEGLPRKTKKIYYENTYKMEPPAKFRPDKVKPIIEKVLEANLEGRTYDPIECSLLCKSISDDIKLQVKNLKYDRYKIICLVTMGEKSEQSVNVGSRFLWDADRDTFCASSWSNKHVYAVATVYALYYE